MIVQYRHFFSVFEKLLIRLCFGKGTKALFPQRPLDKSYAHTFWGIMPKWNTMLFHHRKKHFISSAFFPYDSIPLCKPLIWLFYWLQFYWKWVPFLWIFYG